MKKEFLDYVAYIDEYKATFNSNKIMISIDQLINTKSSTFSKVSLIHNPKQSTENEFEK